MTDTMPNSDMFIAERLRKNILSESRIKRAKAFVYFLSGLGSFLIMVAIGFYIASYGYAALYDVKPVEQKIGFMIADAIKNMELKTDVSGKVSLIAGPLTLDPSSKVSIDPNSHVKISSNSAVTINGNIKIIQPKPSEDQLGLKILSK